MTETTEQNLIDRLRAARLAAARVLARAEVVIALGELAVAGLKVHGEVESLAGLVGKRVSWMGAAAGRWVGEVTVVGNSLVVDSGVVGRKDAAGRGRWVPSTWGMAAAVRRVRMGGEAVSVESVLSVWRDREVVAAMAPAQRAKLMAAAKTARKLRAKYVRLVCSDSWYAALVGEVGVPCYPPAADTPSCRMVRARDLDHLGDQLQPGQSCRRLYPAVYVTARCYSFDAVIESTELRRMRMNRGHDRPVHVRHSSIAVRSRDGSYQWLGEVE